MIMLRNTRLQYGWVARILHWTSVGLVLAAVVIALQAVDMGDGAGKTMALTTHAAFGLAILVIMIVRLYWRTVNVNPVESYTLPRWYRVVGMSLHRGLYCLVIGLALAGLLQLAYCGAPLGVLGRLGVASPVAEDELLGAFWRDVHVRFANLLYPVVAAHVLGAIVHQIFGVSRDVDRLP